MTKKAKLTFEGSPIEGESRLRGEEPRERAPALPPAVLPVAPHVAESIDYVLDIVDSPVGAGETVPVFRVTHRKYKVPLGVFGDLAYALVTMSQAQSKLDEVTKGSGDKVN